MDFLLAELERMSANAVDDFSEEVSEDDVKRWQALFAMGYGEAKDKIQCYREDIDRQRFSDELWYDMKASKEAQGYDREACEYDLFCHSRAKPTAAPVSHSSKALRGLILGGPLDTPESVRDIAGFAKAPAVTIAESEEADGSTSFCYVTADEERRIRQGLSDRGIGYEPCFITINIAAKDSSVLPSLGIDEPTLPQHRANKNTDLLYQHQYPVLYFFYGTLAQPEVLKRVLELDHEPTTLQTAYVLGGKIKTLGRYRALVNSHCDSRVDGHAFMVQSEDQERALRVYETKLYDVVQCDIWLSGENMPMKGLTFRAAS